MLSTKKTSSIYFIFVSTQANDLNSCCIPFREDSKITVVLASESLYFEELEGYNDHERINIIGAASHKRQAWH